jgi:hypothetical protein
MIYDFRFLKWEVPEGVPFSTLLLAQGFQVGVAVPKKGKRIEQEGEEETENQWVVLGFRQALEVRQACVCLSSIIQTPLPLFIFDSFKRKAGPPSQIHLPSTLRPSPTSAPLRFLFIRLRASRPHLSRRSLEAKAPYRCCARGPRPLHLPGPSCSLRSSWFPSTSPASSTSPGKNSPNSSNSWFPSPISPALCVPPRPPRLRGSSPLSSHPPAFSQTRLRVQGPRSKVEYPNGIPQQSPGLRRLRRYPGKHVFPCPQPQRGCVWTRCQLITRQTQPLGHRIPDQHRQI